MDSDSSSEKDSEDSSPTKKSGSEDESSLSEEEGKSKSSGSDSSEPESDNEEKDEEDEEKEEENKSRSSSRSSRSGSRSASSHSRSASDQSDRSESEGGEVDIKKLWQRDPDFYGIRRSSRNRNSSNDKPPKLVRQVYDKRPVSRKGSARKRKISSSYDESSDEEATRSVRKRGTQVVSYKEEESEDEKDLMSGDEKPPKKRNGKDPASLEIEDTIERVMDIRMGKKGATGSLTTVYEVLDKGDPLLGLSEAEDERQFLIKWVNWSHIHNTWESWLSLQEMNAKGLKKLDNYCKKEDELNRWRNAASPEDIEYYECQLELQQELAKAYMREERIIAENKGPDGQSEYYVKWECLPYSDATWESGKLIKKRNPIVIEEFKTREASTRTPAATAKSLRSRPKFTEIKSQPDFVGVPGLNLTLRDYQLDGLNWLVHSWCKENSVILADEMGLGKTIQTICFLSYLFETYNLYGPYLIVVPLSTMAAWQKEFAQWAPQINVVTYLGDISSRDIIRDYESFFKSNRRIKFNAILTTYEIVLKDKQFFGSLHWAILLVDEAHRLKNGDSLLYKTLAEFDTNHRLLITGTPLQNSLKELWSLLHFIMASKFNDWEIFEKEHENAATKGYGKLHKQLEPFILRRVKKDVEKSLPSKVEQILRVEMTNIQKQYYKWILTKNYHALRKGVKGSVTSFINVVMELKKCCNHAMLVRPNESDTFTNLVKGSGKLMLLDKLLVRLKETGHRVLIFSQMVRMLDIIAEYLQQRRFSFQRLDGSIKGDLRKQALDHFNADGSTDFCFLLSTRAGGLGINLATADTVIIFDSDWNPQNDLQAQARAHRIGQKNQVNIYRLVTKNSVEEDIVERAKQKMVLDHLVIQRMDTTGRTVLDKGSKTGTPFNKDELAAILKFGAEELFKEDDNEADDQCDIDEILRRAETHEEASRPGDELLSAFKVASFIVNEDEDIPNSAISTAKDWDDIIPEDLRKKVEEEEKEKEMKGLYLPPRASRHAANADQAGGANQQTPPKKSRKRRKMEESEDESDSDGGKKKKRGRPRMYGKEAIKGFTDVEIRKFIKSFKRFPNALNRIDTLAKDAGLIEKSHMELKRLGELLVERCQMALAETKANPALAKEEVAQDGENAEGKKKAAKGHSFKVGGVNVNTRTFSSSLEDIQPLTDFIPKEAEERKNWTFDLKVKTASYDVDWGVDDDRRILLGVWEHGIGSWEIIKESDPTLKEKIFLEGDKKPQPKTLNARIDYLTKIIRKNASILAQSSKSKVRKKRADKLKEKLEGNSGENSHLSSKDALEGGKDEAADGKETKKTKRPAKRTKKSSEPKHYSAGAQPTAINVLGDLDPVIFNECKEKMRPVKKALKSLDNPDQSLSEKEQIKHTTSCLLQIGNQIETCLNTYTDPELKKQWKSHLWYFVSKFTEYDAHRLYKLYRKALKIDTEGEGVKKDKKKDSKHRKDEKESKEKNVKDKERSQSKHSQESGKREKKSKYPDRDSDLAKGGQENSNSSNPDHFSGNKKHWERDRDSRQLHENDRVPPTHGDQGSYSSSSSTFFNSPRKFQNGPNYNNSRGDRHSWHRDRGSSGDPRERGSGNRDRREFGDPRDRSSGDGKDRPYHQNKSNYYHNYDRGGASGSDHHGRHWNKPGRTESRWSNNYPNQRRESTGASSTYNNDEIGPAAINSVQPYNSYPNAPTISPPLPPPVVPRFGHQADWRWNENASKNKMRDPHESYEQNY